MIYLLGQLIAKIQVGGKMSIDWKEIQKAVIPIKGYEDLYKRLDTSFTYSFVREAFNFKLDRLVEYIQQCLGGDLDHRYGEYKQKLTNIFTARSRSDKQARCIPCLSSLHRTPRCFP
jgi:hypothetical protein